MDSTVSKLILLYTFEQLDIPATLDTLNDMCCSQNSWLSYMTLAEILPDLVDCGFLTFSEATGIRYYKITQDGRNCLQFFYLKILFVPHVLKIYGSHGGAIHYTKADFAGQKPVSGRAFSE